MLRRIACIQVAACVATVLLLTPAAHAAAARQTVTALLEDTSTDPSVTRMEIVLDHRTIKAGPVTLRAINRSKTLVHEVLVLRDPGKKALPYDRAKQEVDEHKIQSLGEVGDLAPGSYLLFCNEPGHYAEGMKTTLTVTR